MNARPPSSSRDARELLRRLSMFERVGDADLGRLAAMAKRVRVRRKASLFVEGAPYRGLYVVVDGIAVVYRTSPGGRMLILDVCRPGDAVVEFPLFDDAPVYPAHAKATRDLEAVFLPRDRLRAFLRGCPEASWGFLRTLAGHVRDLSNQLEGMTLHDVRSRVARYLLGELGDSEDDRFELTLTKASIASYLGTSQETLSRTFAHLARDRIAVVEGRVVHVLDRERLAKLV